MAGGRTVQKKSTVENRKNGKRSKREEYEGKWEVRGGGVEKGQLELSD